MKTLPHPAAVAKCEMFGFDRKRFNGFDSGRRSDLTDSRTRRVPSFWYIALPRFARLLLLAFSFAVVFAPLAQAATACPRLLVLTRYRRAVVGVRP